MMKSIFDNVLDLRSHLRNRKMYRAQKQNLYSAAFSIEISFHYFNFIGFAPPPDQRLKNAYLKKKHFGSIRIESWSGYMRLYTHCWCSRVQRAKIDNTLHGRSWHITDEYILYICYYNCVHFIGSLYSCPLIHNGKDKRL